MNPTKQRIYHFIKAMSFLMGIMLSTSVTLAIWSQKEYEILYGKRDEPKKIGFMHRAMEGCSYLTYDGNQCVALGEYDDYLDNILSQLGDDNILEEYRNMCELLNKKSEWGLSPDQLPPFFHLIGYGYVQYDLHLIGGGSVKKVKKIKYSDGHRTGGVLQILALAIYMKKVFQKYQGMERDKVNNYRSDNDKDRRGIWSGMLASRIVRMVLPNLNQESLEKSFGHALDKEVQNLSLLNIELNKCLDTPSSIQLPIDKETKMATVRNKINEECEKKYNPDPSNTKSPWVGVKMKTFLFFIAIVSLVSASLHYTDDVENASLADDDEEEEEENDE